MRPINNNSDDYDKRYMKIKLNIGDDLPLKKILELHNIIIVVRSFFFLWGHQILSTNFLRCMFIQINLVSYKC